MPGANYTPLKTLSGGVCVYLLVRDMSWLLVGVVIVPLGANGERRGNVIVPLGVH